MFRARETVPRNQPPGRTVLSQPSLLYQRIGFVGGQKEDPDFALKTLIAINENGVRDTSMNNNRQPCNRRPLAVIYKPIVSRRYFRTDLASRYPNANRTFDL